jgi:hypothetical protein
LGELERGILVLRDWKQREIASRMLREGEDPLVAGRIILHAHSAKKSNVNAPIRYARRGLA